MAEIVREVFRANLLRWRKERGLSQSKFAQKMGCTVGYVSMLERGTREPSLDFVEDAAKVLDVTPEMLLTRKE